MEPGGLVGSAPRLASRGLAPPEGLWPGNHLLSPWGKRLGSPEQTGNRRLLTRLPQEGAASASATHTPLFRLAPCFGGMGGWAGGDQGVGTQY